MTNFCIQLYNNENLLLASFVVSNRKQFEDKIISLVNDGAQIHVKEATYAKLTK